MTAPRLRPLLGALLAACAAAAPLVALPAQDGDETVKDFKQLFRKFESSADRVEVVMALAGIESAEVVDALAPVLADEDPAVVRAAVEVLTGFESEPARAAVGERFAEEKKRPIRIGLLRVIELGRYAQGEEVDEALVEALEDKDWELRMRAAAALVALRPGERLGELVPLLSDPEPAVRAEVFDALARRGFAGVIDPALAALEDPVWQVRASAIAALGLVRHKRSVAPLIERMELEEGRLVADCGDSLERLTGRRFGQDLEGWKTFWGRFGDRFELPTDEELAARAAAAAEEARRYRPGSAFFEVETPSRSIRFVIDVSGSMENLIVNKEAFGERSYESWARLEVVKTELMRTLDALEPNVNFDIVAFATKVDPWRGKLVPANALQKAAAIDWVGKLEPIGTGDDADLVAAGLGSADAGRELGKTNSFGALAYAMGARDERGRPTDRDEYQATVDTIVFLSDGRPTHGELVDPDDILIGVAEANELRRVVIHVIAIGQFQKTWMQKLAEGSGGVFVDLGW